MQKKNKAEETAFGLAILMLLEAVGLLCARAETLGAVIAIFAATATACFAKWMMGEAD
jgi:4-amino-4-deoxy-L-arabinose transferase-like glycosyltransferase